MFLVAVKTAIVESLRSVWFSNQNQEGHLLNPALTENDKPLPRRITVEYPEEAQDWPFILVQVRPSVIQWTGIMPEEIIDAANPLPPIDFSTDVDPAPPEAPIYKLIRQGRFEATCMLQIMSTTSEERDRIWDNIVKLLLMGRQRPATENFYKTLENHDLVGITVIEGQVDAIGDTISMGTPWDPELLSYEASIQFNMVGTFYADEYTQDLVPLKTAQVFEYISWEGNPEVNELPPGEGDGDGEWLNPYE